MLPGLPATKRGRRRTRTIPPARDGKEKRVKDRLLVVDDEPGILSLFAKVLTVAGYSVTTADRMAAVPALIESEHPALVLLDVMLPDGSGLDLLDQLKTRNPDIEVVMASGQATVDMAVAATKAGAYDFVQKPVSAERLLVTVARALERRALSLARSARDADEDNRYRLVGESASMRAVRAQIERVAPTTARVLVTGESGTGKELVAYWLHRLSPRRERPFVRLNCAAVPRELMESELFGHEKGAFTGALAARPGRFEMADTGTVLLDEIGDMELGLQAKLLRVLENGEFERVGSNGSVKVDIRVVAATNKNLLHEIEHGRFRADLYHRLNVFTIALPPLREHREDIPLLTRHLLNAYCRTGDMPPREFAPDALAALEARDFPGNVRELRNVVERAAIVTPGPVIAREAFAAGADAAPSNDLMTRARPLDQARTEFEKAFLEHHLKRLGWNITKVAAELQVERSNLSRRLKQLGIARPAEPA
jgi:two-component system, NtrC family, nitrogen regulation response regulator NtrX